MDSPTLAISPILQADACFALCRSRDLARVLPHIEIMDIKAGDWIYQAGEMARFVFLVVSGEARAVSPSGIERIPSSARLGEEAASESFNYLTSARAVTDLRVLAIPRSALQQLMACTASLKSALLLSMATQLSGETLQQSSSVAFKPKKKIGLRLAGWVLSLALPLLMLWGGRLLGLDENIVIFTAIFGATVSMWAFSLMDDYIPALFALLAILLTGLVPASVILSGFASDGFMMAMCTLALGAVVVSSGLGYRFMLNLQLRLPNKGFWHFASLFVTGTLLTPIIPTANGRIALLNPFLTDLVESLRLRPQASAATRLALASFGGISLFSAMIMTSKSVNFAVYALLSTQGQEQFQWLSWLSASIVAAIAMLALFLPLVWLATPKAEKPHLPKACVAEQLALLGKPAAREWAAIIGVIFVMVGILTTSIHHVPPMALVLTMLVGLLFTSTLNKKEFKEKVDWTFLLYLSGVTGLVGAIGYLGIDKSMGAAMPGLGELMRTQFVLFVFLLFVLVNVIRLVMPINATIVVLAAIFMPLADISGINPWVIGFIILLFSEAWFFPYQCSYYLPLQELNREQPLYNERTFLRVNAFMNLARLLAVYASLPYWKMLGLL